MLDYGVAARYAQALFLVKPNTDRAKTLAELELVDAIWAANPDFKELCFGFRVNLAQKQAVLARVFEGQISGFLRDFLMLLVKKGRLEYFWQIKNNYARLLDAEQNVVAAELYTARPWPETMVAQVESHFSQHLNKTIRLTLKAKPELIGGFQFKTADVIYDGSVLAALQQLKQRLLAE